MLDTANVVEVLGIAEVTNFDLIRPVEGEEDVRGLDVRVDDAQVVEVADSLQQLKQGNYYCSLCL